MKLPDAVFDIVSMSFDSMTPQQIRDQVKSKYPQFYGIESAQRAVAAGHSKDLDHSLLQSVYTTVKNDDRYAIDRSTKPYRVSVQSSDAIDEALDLDAGEDPEKTTGIVYVLGTGVYTKSGKRIVKIGYTTQDLPTRIRQLYTTAAMFKFEEIASYEVECYDLLEHALHKLLAPFRLNNAREFFAEDAIPFVVEVVELHRRIQAAPGAWGAT
ncbi:GIY-YIG nuclease family protein (plasmid) [Burkholderia aenigmatica]|uniref:GIY-YIG nuclease family protein n=1 Tax=Burkholderia aenigmatica TaxID=2015348 RepID=UPI003B437088